MKNTILSNHNTKPQSFRHNNHSDAKRSLTGNTFLLNLGLSLSIKTSKSNLTKSLVFLVNFYSKNENNLKKRTNQIHNYFLHFFPQFSQ
ncbi:hypothetical protein PRUPE_3G084100 [Prunus persica]|uniref:Uncharacterized protein n=1 Tax=Prunus persica TaxID=3760 RepID=M5XG17_PRUPE|nr:hypothetical protein PRUPE_3G084100 [Prunus persica]